MQKRPSDVRNCQCHLNCCYLQQFTSKALSNTSKKAFIVICRSSAPQCATSFKTDICITGILDRKGVADAVKTWHISTSLGIYIQTFKNLPTTSSLLSAFLIEEQEVRNSSSLAILTGWRNTGVGAVIKKSNGEAASRNSPSTFGLDHA